MSRSFFIILSLFLLSGCGVRGGLEVPPPLFGDANRAAPPLPEVYERDDTRRGEAETMEATLPSGERIEADPTAAEDPFAEEEPDGDGDS